jgi:hypothetical protein
MMIKNWLASLIIVASAGGALLAMTVPQIVAADPPAGTCNDGFLGFPAWYRGLTFTDSTHDPCAIKSPDGKVNPDGSTNPTLSQFIWHVGLNVLEIALVAIGYLSGFYFLYGGFLFISSQGKPDSAAKARLTMIHALIGLLISLGAVALVTFVVGKI